VVRLDLTTFVVRDYDEAIAFFTEVLGFIVSEDRPSHTNDGRPKRWVVVRPPDAGPGLLLAKADGPEQERVVGNQAGGRVTFFLRVDDFEASHALLVAHGVELVGAPRNESYGRLQVFRDLYGNAWDLLGPADPPDPAGMAGFPG
jgi:catechol 2,3-dioxygenase-like lactoylglutathione lyase family enzyme